MHKQMCACIMERRGVGARVRACRARIQLYRSSVCNTVFAAFLIIHSYVSICLAHVWCVPSYHVLCLHSYACVVCAFLCFYLPCACVVTAWCYVSIFLTHVCPGVCGYAQGKSEGKVPLKFQLPPGTIAAHSTG